MGRRKCRGGAFFVDLASKPQSLFERGSACATGLDYPSSEIRLKIWRSDGSVEILASADLGCHRNASPDLTGVIPYDLLHEIDEALKLKPFHTGSRFQRNVLGIYYKDERLLSVDHNSFEVFDSYARDHARVYFESRLMEGVDRSSFTPVAAGWAKDRNRVYFNGEFVADAESATFMLDPVNARYAVDSRQVYHQGQVVPGIDPTNFTCLDGNFCKNTSQVLFLNALLQDVDAPSFVVDGCSNLPRMLCTAPYRRPVFCKVHDKNRSFELEQVPTY
jgi:hypothetical protein